MESLSIVELNIFDDLINNAKILKQQEQSLAPSATSDEAIFKQLWTAK